MSSLWFDQEQEQEPLDHPVIPVLSAFPAIAPPCHFASPTTIDDDSESSLTTHHGTRKESTTNGGRSRVIIDMLPDVVLLEIFDFYAKDSDWSYIQYSPLIGTVECALVHRITLLHVCQKWRYVAFGSPQRLNLRIQVNCGAGPPVREMLDIWPPLPIVLSSAYHPKVYDGDYDRVYQALEHNDRLYAIELLDIPSSQLGKFLLAMQKPFQTLTYLTLGFKDETTTVDPSSFLGGSAPSLQSLTLYNTPLGLVQKLGLFVTHVVRLQLWNIHFGHSSPDTMATFLSTLTRLETLFIVSEFPAWKLWKGQRPPPPTRILLPILTEFHFRGAGEYLDDIVAWIDAPLLNKLEITFFHQLIFDTPRLAQFISRIPKFKANCEAHVIFSDWDVTVTKEAFGGRLGLKVLCRQLDWQLSSLAQVCSSSLPQTFVHTIEHLYIREVSTPHSHNIESSQWLELLRPLTAVKDLYLSPEFVPRILPALEELIGEGVTEVLPDMQALFLDEPLASGLIGEIIARFVAARRSAGHPIAVSRWKNHELHDD